MDVTKEISAKAPEFVSIDNEAFRSYTFPTGTVTINNPVKLNVKRKPEGDSHRIIDANGVSHYIPTGWIHLSWKGKTGEPEYSF